MVPEVAFLYDKPVGPETEQRHSCQILGTAIHQPGLSAPRHGRLIAVDDRCAKLALSRFFLREHAGQIARLRIVKRMLLPERAISIKRADSSCVMLAPAALPCLRPALGCLSRIHMPTIDKSTGKQHGRPRPALADRPTHHAAQPVSLARPCCHEALVHLVQVDVVGAEAAQAGLAPGNNVVACYPPPGRQSASRPGVGPAG
jgi:hypothetical protein